MCVAIALCSIQPIFAQYENYANDGLMFSNTNFGGTARSMGLAGAQTALGADISSASINPAGLGMIRRSEFTFSPMYGYGNSTSNLFNNNINSNYNRLALGNIGAVFSFAKDDLAGGKWRGGSLSISMSRVKDFNNSIGFSGINESNSMTQHLIESANGTNDEIYLNEGNNNSISSLQSLAYNAYVINPINPSGDNKYQTLNGMVINKVNQSGYVNTSGRINEWNIAGGLNYDDKIYFGGGIGIMGLQYEENTKFTETMIDANPLTIKSFNFLEGRTVDGLGFKVSGGIIARPNDHIKIGLSLISPTVYSITETFKQKTFNSTINNNVIYPGETTALPISNTTVMGEGTNSYTLTSPGVVNLGVALTNKLGLISADISSVNYAGVEVKDPGNPLTYSSANNFAINNFKSTINTRIGAELKLDVFRLRAGYAYYGDPTKGIDNLDRSKQFITLGAGYRTNDYYVDIAYINSLYNTVYSPYTMNNGEAPSVTSKNNNTNIMVTCGIFF